MRHIWFKQRFVEPIVAREKTDTYRGDKFRAPAVGETVGLAVGPRPPFAHAVVERVERVRADSIDPARHATVEEICADAGELLTHVVFRVTRSFVPVPAVAHA